MLWFFRGQSQSSTRVKAPESAKRRSTVRAPEVLNFRGREVVLIRRAYKRSIGMTLQLSGRIRVSAPVMAPVARILEFLEANHEWIETNLRKYQSLRDAYPPKSYRAGEGFLFLGQERTLVFARGQRARPKFSVQADELVVEIPERDWRTHGFDSPERGHPELSAALIDFYAREGKLQLAARLEHYSLRMALKPTGVSFRSQKTRWGSCSSRGRISLNWRLIVAPLDVIDYVVVHELAHLKHYNHSQAFWKLVESQLSNYREAREWLRRHQYEADFLAKKSELR